MEENEKKEIEESEQPEGKGGKLDAIKGKAKALKDKTKETAKIAKQKTGEFMSVKRNKIIVGACSATAIIALVVGLSVGLTQCSGSGNGGDTSTSSNSGTSSKSDGSSKGDDKTSSSSSSSSSNSSSSGSSQGGDSSSSSSSSSSTHTHQFGTTWISNGTKHWHQCECGEKSDEASHIDGTILEIFKQATKEQSGTKAYKCTVCDTYDTATQIAYTPYMDAFVWKDAFTYDGDFTYTKESADLGCSPTNENYTEIETVSKKGNVIKVKKDTYNFNLQEIKSTSTFYLEKVADETATGGYVYKRYTYDEALSTWKGEEITIDVWDLYATVNFDLEEGEEFTDYQFNDTLQAYETKDSKGNVSRRLTFDNGKVVGEYVPETDGSYVKSEIKYSSEELSIPTSSHTHSFGETWKSNGVYHWHECECGVTNDKTEHTFSAEEITKAASKTENGKKVYTCDVCNGKSQEIEYNPYMDEFNWYSGFYRWWENFVLKTTTTTSSSKTIEEIRKHGDTIKKTVTTVTSSGSTSETQYFFKENGDPYILTFSKMADSWGKSAVTLNDYEKQNGACDFNDYVTDNGAADFTLVDNDSHNTLDVYYKTSDEKIKVCFDMGHIIKLEDVDKNKVYEVKYACNAITLPAYNS